MEKLKMHSPDLTDKNIAKIRELFPGCVTESRDENGDLRYAVDFDQLKQELNDHIIEGPQERYNLNWPGKRAALLAANTPVAKTLRPYRNESISFDATKNLFIEGDNLDALKVLQDTYLGQVKMIYIDPPYNTGNDFIYQDDFAENTDEFLKRSNQKDARGNRLIANTTANGRFHSDWLSMMYSRLRLARALLRNDGCIFMSIDDNEIHNLRAICDEIFGPNNFIANIIWHKMDSPKNSAKYLSEDHDYLLLYAKNSVVWRPKLLPRSDKMVGRYQNPDEDPRGPWLLGDLAARNYYSKGVYPITTPAGKVIEGPPAGSYWRVSEKKFEELDADNRICWGKSGENRPGIKKFLSEVKSGVVPQTYWSWKEVGSTRNAKQELSKLMGAASGDQLFVTPKPVRLIKRMLEISTNADEDSLILDFFAGSGSTAHAVLERNAEDGGNRRWIMVQMPEKASDSSSIADMCLERVRRVGKKVLGGEYHEGWNKDIGFRVVKIDTSNMADVYYTPSELSQDDLLVAVDNVKPGRDNPEDLLFQVLVDWGVDLTLPIRSESVQDKTVFFVNEEPYDLIACFDTGITEELVKDLAKHEPLRVVFRDNGFVSDAVKINIDQMFRQLSPTTDVKSI